MNSITFLFSNGLAALACGLVLVFAAASTGHPHRLRSACAIAWVCLAWVIISLAVTFKARYPSLETAPRPAQWQLGATVASGALLLRVSLLRLNELSAAIAEGEGVTTARLARSIRLQLIGAAALMGFAAWAGAAWFI